MLLVLALWSPAQGDRFRRAPATLPAAPAGTYRNPLGVRCADPDVLRYHGMYYLYATSLTNLGYLVWTSPDLVHWTEHRDPAYAKSDTSWARTNFWAPGVIEHGGKFYMYYSAMGPTAPGKISYRICVAVSDDPLGPFVDVKSPLFDIGKATIDAEPFIDSDGKAYLYYSLDQSENITPDGRQHSWIYVIRLGSDLLSTEGQPVFCAKASQPWEGLPALEDTWNEAPYVFRRPSGTYVMMYSARVFADPLYAVGYATAPSPLGPWTKAPENPILKRTGRISGPGHNCLAVSPDGREVFVVYHTHIHPEGGTARELNIDRITITDEPGGGVKLRINGPTRTPQPMPSGSLITVPPQSPNQDTDLRQPATAAR